MTRYAIGDIQGCLQPLQCLLKEVNFDPQSDQLWLVGDLVNRGPSSLGTLRFIHSLNDCVKMVLGNHDLHFLAIAFGAATPGRADTFDEILRAPDLKQLVEWLRKQPLLYSDPSGDYHMTHAGIPPIWDLAQASRLAREVESKLQSDAPEDFFRHMYGNTPAVWSEQLQGLDRLRVITNYFTRMRFCSAAGELDLDNKLDTTDREGFAPWFSFTARKTAENQILFGHWASLEGRANTPNVFALDTGCVWGRTLTLMDLDSQIMHQCHCNSAEPP